MLNQIPDTDEKHTETCPWAYAYEQLSIVVARVVDENVRLREQLDRYMRSDNDDNSPTVNER